MVGQTLGHYRILEQIGAGGMGVVYRAQDESLGRIVVLKLVGERWLNDPTSRARLLNEARNASALNHPNICTIHEVGEAEGHAYIAMEHVEGRPLGSMLMGGGLPTERVARYGAQIADALSHAHQRGVIHRDLKSANVVITPEGRVKVLDFGLAKRLGAPELEQATRTRMSLTEAGAVVGTLSYLPPEVLRGKLADERSDIWALGVVLYEMTSGKLPFGGETSFDLTSSILRDAPHPLPPHVPPGMRAVVQRCLAKEPGERYQSAVEVRAALEALQSDSAISALVPAPKAARRLWLWPVAVGLLLIGVGIIAAVIQGVPFTIGYTRISKEEAPAGPRLSTGGPASAKPEANEYFERGMLFLVQQYDLPRARQMLERALEVDPGFAEARAWYGFTHMLTLDGGFSNDSAWVYKAEGELRRALQDDPRLGSVHSALAAVYLLQGRKELVPGEVKLALEMNPSSLDAPVQLASYHMFNGDFAAAEQLINQLIAQHPTFHVGYQLLGEVRRFRGDTTGAVRAFHKVLEQDQENVYARQSLAHAYTEAGDLKLARQTLESMSPKYRGNYHIREAWAELLALEGRRAEAQREMDAEVLKFAAANPFDTMHAAEFYAIAGDTEKSLEWLDKAVRAGDDRDQWFRRDPLLANVRTHPRFQQILESIAYRRQQRSASAK